MRVELKEHALDRAKGRRVNVRRLLEQVETIPPAHKSLKWTFPNGLAVVIKDEEGVRYILTAFWTSKKRKRVRY